MSELNSKIPVGHIFPFKLFKNLKRIQKIKKTIKKAVNTLGVKNGPCNVDCIFTETKKLFILEISPRLGATCLPEMLKIYTDVDWDLNTIDFIIHLRLKELRKKKEFV